MQPSSDRERSLSPEGLRRKDEILVRAEQALAGRVRAARGRRSLTALATLALFAIGGAWALARFAARPPQSDQTIAIEPSRMQGDSARTAVVRLDDAALAAELAALGYELAVVEIDGQTELFTPDGQRFDRSAIGRKSAEGGES
jgi:hypothetical protein